MVRRQFTLSFAVAHQLVGWQCLSHGVLKKPLQISVALTIAATSAIAFDGTADAKRSTEPPSMTARGVYDSELGEGGSEIVSYDPFRKQMLVTNGALDRIDIISIRNVDDPVLKASVDLTSYGASVQSVATSFWWSAAAVSAVDPTENGSVVLFDNRTGTVRRVYEVGNLPDSIAFTDNGRFLVVANEAEPICDGADLLVDPEGTISVIDLWRNQVNTADFSAWVGQEEALRAEGIRIFFPGSNAAQDLEPEYVATSKSRTAYVTLQENNAVAVVDLRTATVTDLLPLGYKDHSLPTNGLDPSNEDGPGGEEGPGMIANYDVLGMYMPDTIATAKLGRSTYLVTANEGDARDYSCYSEEIRVKDAGLGAAYLDALEADEFLGRLKTTEAFPTTFDSDGQIEQVYSYGARSFSIWSTDGQQVFDSGDDIEQRLVGTPYFNLDGDTPDGRSDDKGPEPEALAVGSIGRNTFAFVGLERSGGVIMYDITKPEQSTFVQYLNTADLGDVSPEGIVFVPAWQSPTRNPLLLVSNEVSGTTRIVELD